MTSETADSARPTYKPAPLLQQAYDAIQNAFPKNSVQIWHGHERTTPLTTVESYQSTLTHMTIMAELAYTNGRLDPKSLQSIIEDNLPISLLPEEKRRKSEDKLDGRLSVQGELSQAQSKNLAEALNFFKEKENVLVQYNEKTGGINYKTRNDDVLKVLEIVIPAIVSGIRQNGEVRRNEVRKIFKRQYDTHVRSNKQKTREKANAAKKVRISGHQVETLTELEGQELVSLAYEALNNNRSAKAFRTQFSKLGGAVVPVHQDDGTPAFEIYSPIYVNSKDEGKGARVKEHLHRALKQLAQDFATGKYRHISEKHAGDTFDSTLHTVQSKVERPSKQMAQAAANGPGAEVTIKIKTLNGKSVADFASYMIHQNRSSAMLSFQEHPDLNFSIRLKSKENSHPYFEVTLPTNQGVVDGNQFAVAEFLLSELRRRHTNFGKSITKKYVEQEFLPQAVRELHKQSEHELGDRLATIFANTVQNDGLNLKLQPEEAVAANPQTEKNEDNAKKNSEPPIQMFQVQDADKGSEGGISFKFDLPQITWDDEKERWYLPINDERGIEKRFYPTDNQLAYIEAIRNPDKQYVVCQGIPGTAKTFWSVYCALDMLNRGQIDQILYERPLNTTGDKDIGALPGGVDDKVDSYHAVMKNKFIEILGNGNRERGTKIYEGLLSTGAIERFDGLFSAGRTVNYGLVLVDEAQDKDEGELWNLITRPSDTAKMVISGDFETQVHIKKRRSGFRDYFNILGNLPFASAITLGPQDSVRSKNLAAIYEARQTYLKQQEEERLAQKQGPERKQRQPSQPGTTLEH